jgi:hypothetical protein
MMCWPNDVVCSQICPARAEFLLRTAVPARVHMSYTQGLTAQLLQVINIIRAAAHLARSPADPDQALRVRPMTAFTKVK